MRKILILLLALAMVGCNVGERKVNELGQYYEYTNEKKGYSFSLERPGGWDEVPPTFRLEGMNLVTEGLITLGKAGERMAQAKGVHDLPRGEDGATRLVRALLMADKVHFIVGLAVNPQQVDESGRPLRKGLVESVIRDLEARGKLVSVEFV